MKKKILISFLILLIIMASVVFGYTSTYSKATDNALTISNTMVNKNGNLYFNSQSNDTGFMIYPGGKVDEKAYAPLAKLLNDKGYPVVIVKMPLHLSIIDNYKGKKVMEENPNIKKWILIGHSLGGTSASMLCAKYPDNILGIVFLGSYPYKDLSNLNISSLTITGSNDLVLNKEKADEYKSFYPKNSEFITIDGGNHAGYGDYGHQNKDGDATISNEEQQKITSDDILNWINK